MKAKEYYEKFLKLEKEFKEKQAIMKIAHSFISEVANIAIKRHVESDQVFISIIKEQNQKWNELRKFDLRFAQDGFIEFIKYKMPWLREHLREIGKLKC